jgi:large subunit ribosomal protein L13
MASSFFSGQRRIKAGEGKKMKTPTAKKKQIARAWHVVDADGVVLGRLASQVASVLRGKNKPTFTPHMDTGDFVVVINADKVKVTGRKEEAKTYYRYSGYVGGLKETTLKVQRETHPERVIQAAVKGMLPKGPLGRRLVKKLKVYPGGEHPHAAQQPQTLEIK